MRPTIAIASSTPVKILAQPFSPASIDHLLCGRPISRFRLEWGAALLSLDQSLVTTSSSSVLTGPWYLFFAETRYQPPKISGMMIASGV
jgi:hypothetical protein